MCFRIVSRRPYVAENGGTSVTKEPWPVTYCNLPVWGNKIAAFNCDWTKEGYPEKNMEESPKRLIEYRVYLIGVIANYIRSANKENLKSRLRARRVSGLPSLGLFPVVDPQPDHRGNMPFGGEHPLAARASVNEYPLVRAHQVLRQTVRTLARSVP